MRFPFVADLAAYTLVLYIAVAVGVFRSGRSVHLGSVISLLDLLTDRICLPG